jgi:hypothetical protein
VLPPHADRTEVPTMSRHNAAPDRLNFTALLGAFGPRSSELTVNT